MAEANIKRVVCSYCQGWGVERIPVTSNAKPCSRCEGIYVYIEHNGRKLYWGEETMIDTRFFLLSGRFYKSKFVRNIVMLTVIVFLIYILISFLAGQDFSSPLINQIRQILL